MASTFADFHSPTAGEAIGWATVDSPTTQALSRRIMRPVSRRPGASPGTTLPTPDPSSSAHSATDAVLPVDAPSTTRPNRKRRWTTAMKREAKRRAGTASTNQSTNSAVAPIACASAAPTPPAAAPQVLASERMFTSETLVQPMEARMDTLEQLLQKRSLQIKVLKSHVDTLEERAARSATAATNSEHELSVLKATVETAWGFTADGLRKIDVLQRRQNSIRNVVKSNHQRWRLADGAIDRMLREGGTFDRLHRTQVKLERRRRRQDRRRDAKISANKKDIGMLIYSAIEAGKRHDRTEDNAVILDDRTTELEDRLVDAGVLDSRLIEQSNGAEPYEPSFEIHNAGSRPTTETVLSPASPRVTSTSNNAAMSAPAINPQVNPEVGRDLRWEVNDISRVVDNNSEATVSDLRSLLRRCKGLERQQAQLTQSQDHLRHTVDRDGAYALQRFGELDQAINKACAREREGNPATHCAYDDHQTLLTNLTQQVADHATQLSQAEVQLTQQEASLLEQQSQWTRTCSVQDEHKYLLDLHNTCLDENKQEYDLLFGTADHSLDVARQSHLRLEKRVEEDRLVNAKRMLVLGRIVREFNTGTRQAFERGVGEIGWKFEDGSEGEVTDI